MFLISDIWMGPPGGSEEHFRIALLGLRSELLLWYSDRHQEFPAEQLTRLTDLTQKMVGSTAEPHLKLKAMETYGFMLFLINLLRKYPAQILGSHRLLESGRCLERYVFLLRQCPMKMTLDVAEEHLVFQA